MCWAASAWYTPFGNHYGGSVTYAGFTDLRQNEQNEVQPFDTRKTFLTTEAQALCTRPQLTGGTSGSGGLNEEAPGDRLTPPLVQKEPANPMLYPAVPWPIKHRVHAYKTKGRVRKASPIDTHTHTPISLAMDVRKMAFAVSCPDEEGVMGGRLPTFPRTHHTLSSCVVKTEQQ